jgi:hypothetical protein
MSDKNYTVRFTVDQTPQEVFAAINNARGWWSELIEGDTDQLGAVVYYHHQDLHRCTFKITEFVPSKKVVWHVLQNYFSFVHDKTEWTGTDIVFEIVPQGDQTELRFTHIGLVPAYECYTACSDGWSTYIKGSLQSLITTGKGRPNVGEAITDSEQALSQ